MTIQNDSQHAFTIETSTKQTSSLKLSIFGIFTCTITFVLAIYFKEYFLSLLIYFDAISKDYALLYLILIILFILVSLPFIWGYTLCMLICSYVYAFFNGLFIVIIYSSVGMTISFYLCRYVFSKSQCTKFNNKYDLKLKYLNAIVNIIEGPHCFRIILLSRLVPLPFGLTNSIFAITKVSYFDYISASIIGLVPTQILTCIIGSKLKSMSDVFGSKAAHQAYAIVLVQILIAILLMFYMLKLAKAELDKQIHAITLQTSMSQVQLLKSDDDSVV